VATGERGGCSLDPNHYIVAAMAGFFRKVAGAFVEIEDTSGARAGKPGAAKGPTKGPTKAPALDAITDDAAALLAQLEHSAGGARGAAPGGAQTAGGTMVRTAEDVFREAGIAETANSADRLLKVIAGLKMFPPEQQLVMVRAMDQADESWSEPAVLEDARVRQSALRSHLQRIEGDRAERLKALQQKIADTRAEGKSLVGDIDARIAELQTKREAAVVHATEAVTQLEGKITELEAEAERARRGVSQVINALSGLMTFLTGGKAAS
jgi:hypothetical protein